MATTNLSAYNPENIPDAGNKKFGIIVSEWNNKITGALLSGAKTTLLKHGVKEENILIQYVPGSFELTFGAKAMAEQESVDAIITLGCVIRGGTPHFEYVCQGVTQGITALNIQYKIPFIFGLLTTDNEQQALDRAGGIHGNKGDEAAITAIKMTNIL
ncbi:MAG: 6,7-dimethyl-8-ribityllumazine synthase [Candidatus Azobacteroides sp.]|nr:6,7-dimethyl-8-ribityllumazine synthase [Candidatus Azobacteroides sp.]